LLANANYVDFEDLQNDEELFGVGRNPYEMVGGGEKGGYKGTKDALEGYVEELSMNQGVRK
jgi:hypothetical protein